MLTWLRMLIAAVLFCHGLVYIGIGWQLPTPIPAWKGSSSLLGQAVTGSHLNALVVALHVLAGIAIVASALAIGFASSLVGWWRPLAIGGGVTGLVAFAVFWDGQTGLLVEEGALGAVLSAILLAAAMAFPIAQASQ